MTEPTESPRAVDSSLAARLAPMSIAEIDALTDEEVAELMGASPADLAAEPISYWRDAAKIATDEYADRLMSAVEAGHARVLTDPAGIQRRVGGRPRVGREPGAGPSTQVRVRVTSRTRAELERIAGEQGRRLSDVSREALDEYIARHAG